MSTAKKPVATVKANFKKTAAPAKEAMGKAEETVKAVKEEKTVEKKVEKKAAPAAKEEAKKETVKKAPVKAAEKKTAPAAKAEVKEEKKASAKKAEPAKKASAAKAVAEVVLQWNGNDYTYDRLLQSAKDVWQYDQGKNVADFKTAQIYVKPGEGKAYVVVNGTDELSFDI